MEFEVPLHDILVSSFLVVVSVVAILGNGVVLFTIYRHPRLQNSFNVFVVSLALGDICNSVIGTSISVSTQMSHPHITSKTMCAINTVKTPFLTTVQLLSFALMTINRFYRVVKPSKFPRIFTMRRSVMMAVVSWLAPLALYTINFAALTPITIYKLDRIHCHFLSEPILGLFTYLFVFTIPPNAVVVIFYLKTRRFIKKPRTSVWPASCAPTVQLYAEEAKTLRVLLILLIAAYCCVIPAVVFQVMEDIMEATMLDPPHSFSILQRVFENLLSIVFPGIYIFVSRHYRNELHKILTCKCTS